MLSARITIVNRLGLHARAAAQLVRLATGFESHVRLFRPDSQARADAKSILSVLTLAASMGVELEIEVDGADEAVAFAAVCDLISRGFGEL